MADRVERTHPGRREPASPIPAFARILVILCGLCALCARADNLLPNAGFNADIGGWTPNYSGGISLSWNGLDARGSSGSGSLRITNTSSVDSRGYNVFGICVPVTAGQTYHEGASFYFPGGQAQGGEFTLFVQFYSSADCSGNIISNVYAPILSPAPDTWQRLDTQPAVVPAGAIRAFALFGFRKIGDGGSIVGNLDDLVFELAGANLCFSSDDQLCLGSRFRVTAQWTSSTGSGNGHATQLASDTGTFWFFSPNNLEALVKALDACALNGRKWVFAGGLTNVNVVLSVTDLRTFTMKTYVNPLNTAFQPVQDTSAFSTCP